jgi:hypothetical protein
MKYYRLSLASVLPILAILMLTACGGGGGGEPEWYYHFVCNGDPDCLATNFAGTNIPSGTSDQATSNSSTPVTTTAVAAGNYDPTTLMGGNQETCMKLADNTAFCFP